MEKPKQTAEDSDEDIFEYKTLKRFKSGNTQPTQKLPIIAQNKNRPSTKSQPKTSKKQTRARKPSTRQKNISSTNNASTSANISGGNSQTISKAITLSGSSSGKGRKQTNISKGSGIGTPKGGTNANEKGGSGKKCCTPKGARTIHEGNCPFCQMPFNVLVVQSPSWHVTECMDKPLKVEQECTAGLSCDSTIPSHYRKFQHTALATARAGISDSPREGSMSNGVSVPSDQGRELSSKKPAVRQLNFNGLVSPSEDNTTVPSICVLDDSSDEGDTGDDSSKTKPDTTFPKSIKRNHDRTSGSNNQASLKAVIPEEASGSEKVSGMKTESKYFASGHSGVVEMIPEAPSCGEVSDEDIFSQDASDEVTKDADEAAAQTLPPGDDYHTFKSISELLDDACTESDTHGDPERLLTSEPTSRSRVKINADEELKKDCMELQVKMVGKDTGCQEDEGDLEDDEILLLNCAAEVESDYLSVGNSEKQDDVQHGDATDILPSTSQSPIRLSRGTMEDIMEARKTATKQTSLHSFFQMKNPPKNGMGQKKSMTVTAVAPPTGRGGGQRGMQKDMKSLEVASVSGDNGGGAEWNDHAGGQGQRKCPFYKKMPGTPFTVDAFCYGTVPGCKAYFLSHFHYDHYRGLNKRFSQPIYCSQVTANLVKLKIRLNPKCLHPLPLNTPCRVEGIEVTLLEANHCPGAVLFLFKLPGGATYLHTGDFRADPSMEDYPCLSGIRVSQLYLDTTYCDPAYAFPPQGDVIRLIVSLSVDAMYENPNTLIVCGSYTIGKERVFLAIADALNCKVCVTKEKKRIMDCLEDAQVNRLVTVQWELAKVHVLPMGQLKYHGLQDHLEKFRARFDSVLAFEPTGWTHSGKTDRLEDIKPKVKKNNITIYGIPYSEHSSYTEMKRFTQFINPDKILPTVNNGNPNSRRKMEDLFASWMKERKEKPKNVIKQSSISAWVK